MLIGCFVMMLIHSWLMTIVSMVTIVLTLLVTKFLSKFMRKYFPLQQAKLGQLNGQIEEAVSGCKTVKAFTHEGKICQDFNQTSDELKTVGIKAQILGGVMGPCMNTIGNFGFLLIAVVGSCFSAGNRYVLYLDRNNSGIHNLFQAVHKTHKRNRKPVCADTVRACRR